MNKKSIATLFALLLAPLASAHANLKIVTTTTDYADIARQIGGAHVEVHSVMKGPENIHNVIARPSEMVFLNGADLFVHSGLDAEPWRDNLLRGARNPKVNAERPGNVDMSQGIALKDVPAGTIDRSMGDVHAYGNPHYAFNPQNAQRMAATLVRAMVSADPANADVYKQNAAKFVNDIADVHREVRRQFEPYAGLKVVTVHRAWDYFGDAVPIQVVGTIEPHPGITPSPQQVRQLVRLMKEQDVRVVICGTYDDIKLARSVAEQAGAQVVVLPDHVLGVPEAASYQELFRYDVKMLIAAAQAAGVQPKPVPATREQGGGDAR